MKKFIISVMVILAVVISGPVEALAKSNMRVREQDVQLVEEIMEKGAYAINSSEYVLISQKFEFCKDQSHYVWTAWAYNTELNTYAKDSIPVEFDELHELLDNIIVYNDR
jgi:hypothetical protein